jgi:hypothetical protein
VENFILSEHIVGLEVVSMHGLLPCGFFCSRISFLITFISLAGLTPDHALDRMAANAATVAAEALLLVERIEADLAPCLMTRMAGLSFSLICFLYDFI